MLSDNTDRVTLPETVEFADLKARQRRLKSIYVTLMLIGSLSLIALVLALTGFVNTSILRSELDEARVYADKRIAYDFMQLRDELEEKNDQIKYGKEDLGSLNDADDGFNTSDNNPSRHQRFFDYRILRSDPLCQSVCHKNGYGKPITVMLSFDGFAYTYLERNLVKTLDRFKNCGSKAKYMYPSYPSKTFPNHYALATGLYPEAHGIIDNYVYDPAISPDLVDVRRTTNQAYFLGEPIWVTAAKQKLTTACLYWAACAINFGGYMPTYNPPFSSQTTLKERVDQVMKWLLLPKPNRPSLIMAYFAEPDTAGHFQNTDNDVNRVLNSIDTTLKYFLDSLNTNTLLGCVNILIVSDHGMQKLHKRFYVDEMVNTNGMIVSNGVVSRVMLHQSQMKKNDFLQRFKCINKGSVYRVYDSKHLPMRYHYTTSNRIGDVIFEGQAGITFYESKKSDYPVTADHGYDYMAENMKTIFFSAGPSIVKGKEINPIFNVEIYNLVADLLGLASRAPNNGTYGRLHEILVKPPVKSPAAWLLPQCASNHNSEAISCDNRCQPIAQQLSISLPACSGKSPIDFKYSKQTGTYCFLNFCTLTMVASSVNAIARPIAVYEPLVASNFRDLSGIQNSLVHGCSLLSGRFNSNCAQWNLQKQSFHQDFILAPLIYNPALTHMWFDNLKVLVYKSFQKGPLNALRKLISLYAIRYGRIMVISGGIYNDQFPKTFNNSYLPTHLYAIIMRCSDSSWSSNGYYCNDAYKTRLVSLILPNVAEDLNCLDEMEYLGVHLARVRDIELATGLEFFTSRNKYSENQSLRLRTFLSERIW